MMGCRGPFRCDSRLKGKKGLQERLRKTQLASQALFEWGPLWLLQVQLCSFHFGGVVWFVEVRHSLHYHYNSQASKIKVLHVTAALHGFGKLLTHIGHKANG